MSAHDTIEMKAETAASKRITRLITGEMERLERLAEDRLKSANAWRDRAMEAERKLRELAHDGVVGD